MGRQLIESLVILNFIGIQMMEYGDRRRNDKRFKIERTCIEAESLKSAAKNCHLAVVMWNRLDQINFPTVLSSIHSGLPEAVIV